MKRTFAATGIAAALVLGAAAVPARSAPPTVTPSPGYDARLQEQRAVIYQPAGPVPRPVSRRRVKRVHGSAH